MRIYEGSPRQDFEEVFRSIGAFLDQRAMKDVLLVEAPDGFIVQGLVFAGASGSGTWSESIGSQVKETLTFLDDDIARSWTRPRHDGDPPPPRPRRRPTTRVTTRPPYGCSVGTWTSRSRRTSSSSSRRAHSSSACCRVARQGAATNSRNSPGTISSGWCRPGRPFVSRIERQHPAPRPAAEASQEVTS